MPEAKQQNENVLADILDILEGAVEKVVLATNLTAKKQIRTVVFYTVYYIIPYQVLQAVLEKTYYKHVKSTPKPANPRNTLGKA